jgi:hypothetical protein
MQSWKRVALAGSEKEEARPLGQASPLPSIFSPESDDGILQVRKRQISDSFSLFTLKRENVAETSRSFRAPLTPRQKAQKIADF